MDVGKDPSIVACCHRMKTSSAKRRSSLEYAVSLSVNQRLEVVTFDSV
jgi:hypothetical protein